MLRFLLDAAAPARTAFVEIAATEDGAALLDELYEIDGLVVVTSTDYDVIRDLEAQLGDVLS